MTALGDDRPCLTGGCGGMVPPDQGGDYCDRCYLANTYADYDYCGQCSGSGYEVDAQGDHVDCPACGGTGEEPTPLPDASIPDECSRYGCGDVVPECAHKRAAREREAGR